MSLFLSLVFFSAHAELSVGNEIGTLNVDNDEIYLSRHSDQIIKIFGTVSNSDRHGKITIIFTDPNGEQTGQQIFATEDGIYETSLPLNWESLRGEYTLFASYKNKIIGTLSITVREATEHTPITETPQKLDNHDSILIKITKDS